jgi:hypothetical protein
VAEGEDRDIALRLAEARRLALEHVVTRLSPNWRAARSAGISRCEPFVRPEKRRCASTLTGGRGGQGSSDIAAINDRHPGQSNAGVTFDQTAAKGIAPRRFSST